MSTRTLLLGMGIGAVGYALARPAVAQQGEALAAVCVQIPQSEAGTDAEEVAAWMTVQLDRGRVEFAAITGLDTVLCAW